MMNEKEIIRQAAFDLAQEFFTNGCFDIKDYHKLKFYLEYEINNDEWEEVEPEIKVDLETKDYLNLIKELSPAPLSFFTYKDGKFDYKIYGARYVDNFEIDRNIAKEDGSFYEIKL